jgi:HSP20 family molecular chaperone IbpA
VDDFEDFLWRLGRNLLAAASATREQAQAEPYFEVNETDEGVMITAELPLVQPRDLRVTVSSHDVTVSVESLGLDAYTESFETGRTDPRQAKVRFRNGILEIKLPYMKSIF